MKLVIKMEKMYQIWSYISQPLQKVYISRLYILFSPTLYHLSSDLSQTQIDPPKNLGQNLPLTPPPPPKYFQRSCNIPSNPSHFDYTIDPMNRSHN